jgi:hypothetical protein
MMGRLALNQASATVRCTAMPPPIAFEHAPVDL